MKKKIAMLACFLQLALYLTAKADTNAAGITAIGPNNFPALVAGQPFSVPLTVTGGVAPFAWSPVMLPAGFNLNTNSGVVSGTPPTASSVVLFVKVLDSLGSSRQRGWNLSIAPGSYSGGGNTGGGNTPPPPPPPSQYTVTVVNGTLQGGAASGLFAPGAQVTIVAGTPPPGQWFKSWSGSSAVTTLNSQTNPATFTMPSQNLVETAQFYTLPTLASPVSSHPRLWLTTNDLPHLRAWANAGNQVFQQGLKVQLASAILAYHKCFPGNGASPASPYPDAGDIYGWAGPTISINNATGQPDLDSENHELTLAFFSLIDNNASNRVVYAQMARSMFMYEINQAALGHASGLPFRDPFFAIYCRGNGMGEMWPLVADWLQGVTDTNGQPVTILTPSDRVTIRNVFMLWANDCLNAYTTGGDHPSPIGVMNSTALLANGKDVHRVVANNYYANHARLITMMPLAIDPADDLPLNPATPAAVLGNTLRSYILDATGAWLYEQFAIFGDPAAVRTAYNLPASASVGLSSGGLPVEGGMYGHSTGFVLGEMLALQTAGYNDPALSGPQAALVSAPVWDRFADGFISEMMNTPIIFQPSAYLGPIYQFGNYGDDYRDYVTPDYSQAYALLALREQQQGLSNHLNTARWFVKNAVQGGAAGFVNRVASPWSTTESILDFMLMDPNAVAVTDPRPNYPTTFFDAPQTRLIKRTDWSAGGTIFLYRCAPESINHVNGDPGEFELWRNGEWLTKELSNYDNYGNGQSTMWHNTLALKNWCQQGVPSLNPYEQSYFPNGSTWNNGASLGDPVSITSSGANYNYLQSDITPLFNRPSVWTPTNALLDITHASRSLLYLNNDYVVVYDRATSVHPGLFKRFNLNTTTVPLINKVTHVAVETTPAKQKMFVQTLLPANATASWVPQGTNLTGVAESSPVLGRLVVEDTNCPTNVRFLHVIQGGGTNATMVSASLIQSVAGTAFDGAQFGNSLVMFAQNLSATFTSMAYIAAPTATTHYISGLAPLTGYHITEQADPNTGNIGIVVTAGGNFTTDAAGVLVFNP